MQILCLVLLSLFSLVGQTDYISYFPVVQSGANSQNRAELTGFAQSVDGNPIHTGTIRLGEVFNYPDGSCCYFVMDVAHSPGSWITDGSFLVENIPPHRRYVLIWGLGDIYNHYYVITDNSGYVYLIEPEPLQMLDVGTLTIWPDQLLEKATFGNQIFTGRIELPMEK